MESLFSSDQTFADLGLRTSVLKGLDARGFTKPTQIQSQLIPAVLAGRDVLGQAKTGTGKTAAFALPLLHMVDAQQGIQAIILVPTRELAAQVTTEIKEFARSTPVKVATVVGGERRRTQIDRMSRGVSIIVGTPGRVIDFLDSGELSLSSIRFVVLDEVDRMLDIGFRDDIRNILSRITHAHQTIFVSATISPEIESLARKYMHEPEKIIATGGSLTVAQVEQMHLIVQRWDKRRLLLHLLKHEEPALTLVFCATKREVDRVAAYLIKHRIDAHAIHGDMYQRKRDRVMKRFREGELGVLIASDVASRGLDVEGVSHVINYDIPFDPELYVHRIGRTARLGRGGIAWMFVTPEEGKYLSAIEHFINREVPKKEYADFEPGPIPSAVIAERERAKALSEKIASTQSRMSPEEIRPEDAVDRTKFPGGLVPAGPPPRRLGGRLRSRRR